MTSKGQITIPTAIRRRLGLQAGQVLEFDEEAPYIVAVPVFDEEAMRAVVGCARGRMKKNSDEWLDETRGPVDEKVQADRLAAKDRGYLRRYFPDLAV